MKKELRFLWKRMLPITKTRAASIIVANPEFGVSSIEYVKKKWIWGDKMPKRCEAKVHEIFEAALYEEFEETQEMIGWIRYNMNKPQKAVL